MISASGACRVADDKHSSNNSLVLKLTTTIATRWTSIKMHDTNDREDMVSISGFISDSISGSLVTALNCAALAAGPAVLR